MPISVCSTDKEERDMVIDIFLISKMFKINAFYLNYTSNTKMLQQWCHN